MPIHTALASWQFEQPPLSPEWICAFVGAGVAKELPGTPFVADAGISPAGVVPRWQVSQVVDDGICAFAPGGELGGMTTIREMPANVSPETSGPWQTAHPLLMPVWSI
jgi:hypothetical protein